MTHEPADDRGALSRRRVVAAGAALAGGALAGGLPLAAADPERRGAVLASSRPDGPYELGDPANTLYSACLQCNTGCGIKCKLQDGVLTKIDGNPYNPWTLLPHLDYATPMEIAQAVDGSICPKGQAGLQTAYDPYRLRRVLKRAGRRGEDRWVSIPFEQAVAEICEGGRLFASVPGEEEREVEGLRSLVALRDPELASAMRDGVAAIWEAADPAAKQDAVAAFQERFREHLDFLVNPDHPDLGPRNNQIVLAWGRLKGGRSDLYKRFATGLGTVNAHGHTTVCQGSLYFTCKAISNVYEKGEFGGGDKFYWQADLEHARFILFAGANLFEANYGPPNQSLRLAPRLASGAVRIAVADPRYSKLASKAWKWLPLRPGTDAAAAMAIIRWMLDNDRFDRRFAACANRAAALEAGETSWANGSWLVRIDDGRPGAFVRAADVRVRPGAPPAVAPAYNGFGRPGPSAAGLVPLVAAERRTGKDGKPYEERFLLAAVDGRLVPVDPYDEGTPVFGDLFVDGVLPDGTRVKSALQLLLEEAHRHTLEEWCDVAGLRAEDIVAVARELTSHGKRACVDLHRGAAQHTNGFYNVLAWMTVNMLLGNFDHRGGMGKATTWDTAGKKGKLVEIERQPGAVEPFGVSSIRHGVDYEQTTLFAGYPARRNWYPLSSDVYEEILPSIGEAYPYPVKALFFYMGAPTYALPAGHTTVEALTDLEALPLFVANDIVVGSTSMYADYVFPDLSYLERWELQGSHPGMPNKVQPVRQPVIAPVPERCTVFGGAMPICFESMLLGIAERLGLPGFGDDAFGPGLPLRHMDDLYLRAVANLAFGEKPDGLERVPEADDREVELFLAARRHLPPEVFDAERWRAVVGDGMWRRVVTVLSRGGRFEAHDDAWEGDRLAHPYGRLLNLYQEKTANTIHAGTGEPHPGLATYLPVRDFYGREPDQLRAGHDLALITHRTIVHTKSRTVADPWLSALQPENGIFVHPEDAERLGLAAGQRVRVVSATNPRGVWPLGNGVEKPMIGEVLLTQTIRPGVVSFHLGYGHWATGASDLVIDGHRLRAEPRRQKGIHANAAMWVDPALGNTCMLDPVGGSVSFYDTWVRLEPVA
jgi:tetrathionate reductase subunit A